jgi:hypothetical protein
VNYLLKVRLLKLRPRHKAGIGAAGVESGLLAGLKDEVVHHCRNNF